MQSRKNRSRCWSGVGWIGAGAGFLILTFYSVIGGWVLDYVFVSVARGFSGIGPDEAQARFGSLLSSPWRLMLSFTLFLGLTGFIVSTGLRKGIERATGILMPALFVILLVLTVYSAVAGDLAAGLRFLFAVDFGRITPGGHALGSRTRIFFCRRIHGTDDGPMALICRRACPIPRTAVVIAGADTLVALVAGLVIFPLVFANGLAPGEGPGLIFVHVADCIRQHACR